MVPGFIIDSIYRSCVPQEDVKSESALLRFLFFSTINYAVVFPVLIFISEIPYINSHGTIRFYISLLVIFIFSVAIALIISVISNKGWIRTLLQKMGIHTTHVVPTAWDYQFKKEEPRYLTIYLKDGGIVFGYWGADSFASSLRDNKDIFLEKIFDVNEDNEWVEITQNNGLWIPVESVKYIEFH